MRRDAKLERALATPGLPDAIERASGLALVDTGDTSPDGDALKAHNAATLYRPEATGFLHPAPVEP